MTGLISGIVFIAIIIALIIAVLNIVLFFKIWGMTNDIRELKIDHFDNRMPEDIPQVRAYVRENLLLGDKDKVRCVLIHEFLDSINSRYNNVRTSYLNTNDPVLNADITPYVELLKKQLTKLNLDIPEQIISMKTFRDYYEMLKDEDFKLSK